MAGNISALAYLLGNVPCGTDETIKVVAMSTAQNDATPAKPREDEAVKVLREHMDNAKAETVAQRYANADEAAKTAVDWQTAKRLILNSNPKLRP